MHAHGKPMFACFCRGAGRAGVQRDAAPEDHGIFGRGHAVVRPIFGEARRHHLLLGASSGGWMGGWVEGCGWVTGWMTGRGVRGLAVVEGGEGGASMLMSHWLFR